MSGAIGTASPCQSGWKLCGASGISDEENHVAKAVHSEGEEDVMTGVEGLHVAGVGPPKATSEPEAEEEQHVLPGTEASDQMLFGSEEEGMPTDVPKECKDDTEDLDGLGMRFTIELHCAELLRSFACVGRMDPYAVVYADGKELMRTPPHRRGHVAPEWTAAFTLEEGLPECLPDLITITICHRNALRKEISCGSACIPVTEDMGWLDVMDFELLKKGKPTGTVCVSVGIRGCAQGPEAPMVCVGGELDHVLMSIAVASQACSGFKSKERRASRKSCRVSVFKHADGAGSSAVPIDGNVMATTVNADASDSPLAIDVEPVSKSRRCSQMMPQILGSWKCVATQGLDEFLKKSGVGMFQRKIAGAARWPNWDFTASGEAILFVNHSAIGDLKEEIPIGKEYQTKDGHGNALTSFAEWNPSPEGGSLLITRNGSGMNYTEERTVSGDSLEFVLRNVEVGESWGRTFTRG